MAYQIDHGRAAKPLCEPTTDGLISWLETHNPEQTYSWWDVDDCLLCRFSSATGGPSDGWVRFPQFFTIAVPYPWTYGAALERARSFKRNGL